MTGPILETRRLVLRQPQMDDADAIARQLDNFAVSGNLARVPYPYRLADAIAWLRLWRPGRPPEETNFAITLEGQGLVGQIGFHLGPDRLPVLGYWLGQPYWNRGLMTEAAEATIAWFFETAVDERIRSGVFHFNRASLAIQAKLGFTQTGSSLMLCLARNEEVRHIDTELTRASWRARATQGHAS
ncbi:N-acetyltransferase [Arsenicitalea aurantiaca]|uniref:N-acetyltransferase n=1 Tax=Arsenicitalea aurantiaca TaxID=1783274 RepID=A0A433X7H5_9HYPH|nr:GNAT family N-acetyltransferase [Arsenicitalea aurantiaca]RUT30005.1 N-acetyltransferase [Arsenicitalea aurantiaca]